MTVVALSSGIFNGPLVMGMNWVDVTSARRGPSVCIALRKANSFIKLPYEITVTGIANTPPAAVVGEKSHAGVPAQAFRGRRGSAMDRAASLVVRDRIVE